MKQFTVTFTDSIVADSEEQAIEQFKGYIMQCAMNSDVSAFDFIHNAEFDDKRTVRNNITKKG